ncbi:arylsulfatase [Allorhodopirellula solitaria]|uniref:Arylsulfatase n=1 Tax=Allorhodopirellula solitaria TaxID=2527987 RepID=A0A5C5XR38_9BACT|nr:arylsulfatase [Allorhodopirellula solitaria]TWT65099.1 Arylsulfatase precursor [Allorhodopirellula solitaria]
MFRNTFLALLLLLTTSTNLEVVVAQERAESPNVILIMSDDQGGGDYGFMGNDLIRTPHLDTMKDQSGFLSNFYVSPVCAPTRASLMTGRYNYRTRCIDTYIGRAMMAPEEVTVAEVLRDAGYQTGIYGKWHLGDSYPLRAMDQGFQDSLVIRGGGIGQPSDPIGAEGKYTDPILIRNGEEVPLKGYCTDLYFDAAIDFIEETVKTEQPFFTYIATNAPHGPFHDVPDELYQQYQQVDFAPIIIGQVSDKRAKAEQDKLARIAAMITNIDDNVGRLMGELERLGIRDNTIVIYLNDNGPNTRRYVGEMRGKKADVDDGGIRSPLLFHWPARVPADQTSDELCAHIDVMPTILEACGIEPPMENPMDGRSFLPLLTNEDPRWPTRQVIFQAHRGDVPHPYHHFAIHEAPWKLVHPSGFGRERFVGEPKIELYNLNEDPRQQHNLVDERPQVTKRLLAAYHDWFEDVSSTRPDNYAPPRIVIGTEHEPSTVLTRQDWRHIQGTPWAAGSNGLWKLEAREPATYRIELIFRNAPPSASATIRAGEASERVEIETGDPRGHFATMELPAGQFDFQVDVDVDGTVRGPHQVIVSRSLETDSQ